MSTMSDPKVQQCSLPDFKFLDGTAIPDARLAYLDFNAESSKIAVVITCFRGRLLSTLNFADGALRGYRVIVIALFGNGESSSPSNTAGFPASLDYRDCVAAQHYLITHHLGIKSIDVMLGFSMGGQCTYYWIAMHPEIVHNAVIMCSSARTSRHNYQFLEGPRAALESSVDYADDAHRATSPDSPRGLRAFGKAYSAWLTSFQWFDKELYKELGYGSLAEWDEDVTSKNYRGWTPDDLLVKLRMWQRGDITVCSENGTFELPEALSRIQARVLLMPCETDQYFDWRASQRECNWLKEGYMRIIPSVWGHLAGSGLSKEDAEWINHEISEFLVGAKA